MTAFTSEGSLHVMWTADQPPHLLSWYKIDLSTGHSQSLLRTREFSYHLDNYQACMVHLASGQALGMFDVHTVVIMDADTARELCQISLAARHGAHARAFIKVAGLAWSSHGDMVAIGIQVVLPPLASTSGRDGEVVSWEVHIYNTSGGECLRSASFPSNLATSLDLSWSSSMNILAVLSRPSGRLTVLDADSPAAPAQAVIHFRLAVRCLWTPCGSLLLLVSHERGFYILDPQSLQEILHAPQPVYERPDLGISWASKSLPGSGIKTVTAYLRGPRSIITCWLIAGNWHARQDDMRDHGGWFGGCIAPSGDALVVIQPQNDNTTAVIHADLRAADQKITRIAPAYTAFEHLRPHSTRGAHIKPTWTPFPRSWPSMYAYARMPLNADPSQNMRHACPRSVRLVDANAHAVVGNWTVTALDRLAQQGEFKSSWVFRCMCPG